MGLDLIVEGCAKAGHEREWRELLQRSFDDEELSDAEVERFQEISVPGYERIGAPRVGSDKAADQWILEAQGAKTPDEIAAVLKEFAGYHVVRLVECDGVPRYSHGGMYEGADDTSFRGKFLEDCGDVISEDLLNQAWEHKFPDQAVAYGRSLLAAADAAEAKADADKAAAADQAPRPEPEPEPQRRGFLARLFPEKKPEKKPERKPSTIPVEKQLDIVRAAGRWYIFWGERGHPIRAWF